MLTLREGRSGAKRGGIAAYIGAMLSIAFVVFSFLTNGDGTPRTGADGIGAALFPRQDIIRCAPRGPSGIIKGNPFLTLGGSWVWTTRDKWVTSIWYVSDAAARPVRLVTIVQPTGGYVGRSVSCEYRVAPGGRWVLCWWRDMSFGHWLLFDRRTGRKRLLPDKMASMGLEDPAWYDGNTCAFRGASPSRRTPVWLLDARTLKLRLACWLAYDDPDVDLYHSQFDLRSKQLLKQLRSIPPARDRLQETAQGVSAYGLPLSVIALGRGTMTVWSTAGSWVSRLEVFKSGAKTPSAAILLRDRPPGNYFNAFGRLDEDRIYLDRLVFDPSRGVGSIASGWDSAMNHSRYQPQLWVWSWRTRQLRLVALVENALLVSDSTVTRGMAKTGSRE